MVLIFIQLHAFSVTCCFDLFLSQGFSHSVTLCTFVVEFGYDVHSDVPAINNTKGGCHKIARALRNHEGWRVKLEEKRGQ